MSRDYIDFFTFDGTVQQLIEALQKIRDEYGGDLEILVDVSSNIRDIEFDERLNIVNEHDRKVIIMRLSNN